MFDFKFEKPKTKNEHINLILNFKKILPKKINSITDGVAIDIFENIINFTNSKKLMIETGVGSSTIAMFLACAYKNKKFYTFDPSDTKLSLIKNVINEAICENLNIKISDYWSPINSNSENIYTGMNMLKDLRGKFDFVFLDSIHSYEHITSEIDNFINISSKNFVIGIDDTHLNYRKYNEAFINLIRVKNNFKTVNIKNNSMSLKLEHSIYNYLKKKLNKVGKIKSKNQLLKKDNYIKYYDNIRIKPTENPKFIKNSKASFFKGAK